VASLSQGRTAAAQCGLFTHKSVPVIFEPPCIKETLTTSAQYIIGEKQHERNEEWCDQECREIIEIKREPVLKCLPPNTRANKEDYNRKRTAAARLCRRKKREVKQRKVDEIMEHHTKNESNKYYKRIQDVTQEFEPRVNACRDANDKILREKGDIQRRWKEYFEGVLTVDPDDTAYGIFYSAK